MDRQLKTLVEQRNVNYMDQKFIDEAIIKRVIEIYNEDQRTMQILADGSGGKLTKAKIESILYFELDND